MSPESRIGDATLDQVKLVEQERGERSLDHAWIASGLVWSGVVIALLLIFHGTVSAMVLTWWHSSTYQHCFLIPLIVGFLVWERRDLFGRTSPQPAPWALLIIAGAGFLWVLGRLSSALIIEELALVFMIQASVLLIFGPRVTRALIFPIAFLLFAVPFGDFLVQPLQKLTADMSVWLLQVIGIPTFREGLFISTPSGDFHVAEACSGVRFLVAMLPLGVLFANLSFKSRIRRAAVIALAIVVPIIANGIRAFGIIYIAYLTDNEYAVGVDHLIYGWVFFAIVTVLLIAIGTLFADKPSTAPAADYGWVRPAPRLPTLPRTVVLAVTGAVLAGLWAIAGARMLAVPDDIAMPAFEPPRVSGDWSAVSSGDLAWQASFSTASQQMAREYVRGSDGARVIFYFAYYPYQREGAALIEFGNTLFPGRWTWHGTRERSVELAGEKLTVNDSRIANIRTRRQVWSWYWIGGFRTSNVYLAKLAHLWAMLSHGDDSGAVLAVSTEVGHRPDAVAEIFIDFFAHAEADLPGFPGPAATRP